MNNQRWYGGRDRGGGSGGGDIRQSVFLIIGVALILGVLLAVSHFSGSVPNLPLVVRPAGVEDTSPVSTPAAVTGALHYLNCVSGDGNFWRASYLQSELSGAGMPNAAASQLICADPLRRVPSE